MYRYTDDINVYPYYKTNYKLLNLANTSQDSYIARNVYLILKKSKSHNLLKYKIKLEIIIVHGKITDGKYKIIVNV